MYLTTFKLKEAPFQAEPDTRFLYLSQAHARAQAYMEAAPTTPRTRSSLIIGASGTGKSVLTRRCARSWARRPWSCTAPRRRPRRANSCSRCSTSAVSCHSAATATALLDTLIDASGRAARGRPQGAAVVRRRACRNAVGARPSCAILAGAAEAGGTGLLRTVLVGLPRSRSAWRRLSSPRSRALLRLQLQLSATHCRADTGYIVHRLAIAGSQGREIFEAAAFEAVHRHAGGVPRQINLLCDAALRAAAAAGREPVAATDVDAAARALQWPDAARGAPPRTPRQPAGGASARHLAAQRGTGAAAAPVGRLRVQLAGQVVAEQELYRGRMMIGRATDADLRIDDRTISRHHCQIICTDEHSVIQDLNSTNGVYVNERRVRRHLLDDGEVFVLGAYQVAYSRSPARDGRRQRAARRHGGVRGRGDAELGPGGVGAGCG